MSEPIDLADFLKRGAAEVGAQFDDPADDWAPVLVMERTDGKVQFFGFQEFDREAGPDVVAEVVRTFGARAAAMLVGAWFGVAAGPPNPTIPTGKRAAPVTRPSESPDRVEVLLITEWRKHQQERTIMAKILRDEVAPPQLDEWETVETVQTRYDVVTRALR